ncbi:MULTISPECIES: type II toxin-antitoxin system HicB family antitoxin [unclassified Erwinia]|uniref:type II toxin-antitoxin system HicB family antitoxin n=1 Tax=unclassified Erwinia TaxID=2622719 RepID=UPI00092E8C84|nr:MULTISPECIES: type II toxin-antitoxin system HicB family antitoxin [unclassified Erwinia]
MPSTTCIEAFIDDGEYAGTIRALVDVDVTPLMGKAGKINVTLPMLPIRRINRFVANHPGYRSRSEFLARAATERFIKVPT